MKVLGSSWVRTYLACPLPDRFASLFPLTPVYPLHFPRRIATKVLLVEQLASPYKLFS